MPDRSLILEARRINDESPADAIRLVEQQWGAVDGRSVALLGAAYRFNSEDTRNSPTLALAQILMARGCRITIHDPYVKPDDQNLQTFGLTDWFTNDVTGGGRTGRAARLLHCSSGLFRGMMRFSLRRHEPR